MAENQSYDGPVFAIYQSEDYVHLFGKVDSVDYFGIPCIKGTLLSLRKDDWRTGLTCYIPTSSITRIFEYKSMDHYKTVIATHYEKRAEV